MMMVLWLNDHSCGRMDDDGDNGQVDGIKVELEMWDTAGQEDYDRNQTSSIITITNTITTIIPTTLIIGCDRCPTRTPTWSYSASPSTLPTLLRTSQTAGRRNSNIFVPRQSQWSVPCFTYYHHNSLEPKLSCVGAYSAGWQQVGPAEQSWDAGSPCKVSNMMMEPLKIITILTSVRLKQQPVPRAAGQVFHDDDGQDVGGGDDRNELMMMVIMIRLWSKGNGNENWGFWLLGVLGSDKRRSSTGGWLVAIKY